MGGEQGSRSWDKTAENVDGERFPNDFKASKMSNSNETRQRGKIGTKERFTKWEKRVRRTQPQCGKKSAFNAEKGHAKTGAID